MWWRITQKEHLSSRAFLKIVKWSRKLMPIGTNVVSVKVKGLVARSPQLDQKLVRT